MYIIYSEGVYATLFTLQIVSPFLIYLYYHSISAYKYNLSLSILCSNILNIAWCIEYRIAVYMFFKDMLAWAVVRGRPPDLLTIRT